MDVHDLQTTWDTQGRVDPLWAILSDPVKKGGRRYAERCRYCVNATADLARFPTGHFDLVLSYLTLQHIPPRYTKQYIREFMRITRRGGIVCFQLPTAPAAISAAVAVPVGVVVLALGLTLVIPPSYRAEGSFVTTDASIELPRGLAELATDPGLSGLASQLGVGSSRDPSHSPAFYAQLLRSRELL